MCGICCCAAPLRKWADPYFATVAAFLAHPHTRARTRTHTHTHAHTHTHTNVQTPYTNTGVHTHTIVPTPKNVNALVELCSLAHTLPSPLRLADTLGRNWRRRGHGTGAPGSRGGAAATLSAIAGRFGGAVDVCGRAVHGAGHGDGQVRVVLAHALYEQEESVIDVTVVSVTRQQPPSSELQSRCPEHSDGQAEVGRGQRGERGQGCSVSQC